jgi:hypothetical protein
MVITPRSVFIHLPRTGGCWVSTAIAASGVPRFAAEQHCTPDVILPATPDRESFTFVRHPVAWWRSWWAFTGHAGAWPSSGSLFTPVIRCCLWPSYADFMERVLADIPGEYSRLVNRYTAGVHHVGRTENLAADFTRIWARMGEPAPGRLPGPVNTGTYDVRSASTPEIDAEITRTEAAVISAYYGGAG